MMVHAWLKATDRNRNNLIQVMLLDYAKSFDHIDPNILLRKMENMTFNIPDGLLRWVKSFLNKEKPKG